MDIAPIAGVTSAPAALPEGVRPVQGVAPAERAGTAPYQAAPGTPGRQETRLVVPQPSLQVEVGWHAPSSSIVHRFIDVHTRQPVRQFPAAQVLEVVADLMRRIRNH